MKLKIIKAFDELINVDEDLMQKFKLSDPKSGMPANGHGFATVLGLEFRQPAVKPIKVTDFI